MPIIKRAIKKLASDRRRHVQNTRTKQNLQSLVKSMRKSPTPKLLTRVFQALDKASKHNVIHANKAARLKSRLSKLLKK